MLVYCLWMNKEEISVAMLRGALLPTLWFSASDVRFTVAANLVKFLYSDEKNHRYCLVPGFLRSSIFLLSAHLKTPLTNSVSHFGSVDEGLTSLKVIILKISNVLFFFVFFYNTALRFPFKVAVVRGDFGASGHSRYCHVKSLPIMTGLITIS